MPADPIVLADLPARALSRSAIDACADALRGRVDAVLAGDSPAERVQFPPAYRARLLQDAGFAVWSGVNCRDRNRVALEGELAALADVGVDAVLCVTGDHPSQGSRPDAAAVFDLDSTALVPLAVAAGLRTAVAVGPAVQSSPPPLQRMLAKEAAGATVAFVDHCGGVEAVAAFVGEARGAGSRLAFIPCVPTVVDAGSGRLLQSFPGLALPPGFLDGILAARDPRAAGIAAAVRMSRELLAIDGVIGVDLSGGPGADDGADVGLARAMGEIADRLRAP